MGSGIIFAVLWFIIWVGLLLFVVKLLYRMTIALEKIARHLLEITREYKKDRHYSGEDL